MFPRLVWVDYITACPTPYKQINYLIISPILVSAHGISHDRVGSHVHSRVLREHGLFPRLVGVNHQRHETSSFRTGAGLSVVVLGANRYLENKYQLQNNNDFWAIPPLSTLHF